MRLEAIESTILKRFDGISEIGVFKRDKTLHALIYPDFLELKQKGILNIWEFMRLEVIDRYNQHASPAEKIKTFTLVKDAMPKTRGEIDRALLESCLNNHARRKMPDHEPTFQEYRVLKKFLDTLTGREILPDDHLEIDLALNSLDKVSLQVFLESTFGIKVNETTFIDYFSALTLAEYIRERRERVQIPQAVHIEPTNWGKILREGNDLHLPRSRFPHTLILSFVKTFVRGYFRLHGEGLENLPGSQVILVANHQCFFDGFIIARFLTNAFLRNTYVYAVEKHFNTTLRRFVADTSNVIIVNINRDLKISLQKMAAVLQKGKNIIIFPEGTRTKDGLLGPFKNTFAILSCEFNVPIVPVVIQGGFEAMPIGSHFPKPWSQISVTFLRPIYAQNFSYEVLAKKVHQEIGRNL